MPRDPPHEPRPTDLVARRRTAAQQRRVQQVVICSRRHGSRAHWDCSTYQLIAALLQSLREPRHCQ